MYNMGWRKRETGKRISDNIRSGYDGEIKRPIAINTVQASVHRQCRRKRWYIFFTKILIRQMYSVKTVEFRNFIAKV